ncbi:MAG: ribosome maturation factor RimP [Nocardioidaceae bacterium]|nr:ribosome maturation factor RimP [Nocardioidaceae bacterium]
MSGQQPKEAVLEVVTQPLASSGLDLEDVEMSVAGRRQLVRLLVDKSGGVTLDEIAEATRLVSSLLDEQDVLGDAPYTLEVTSPGIDRPLTLPRHWQRNISRLVKVTPREGAPFIGRVMAAGESSATLDVEGDTKEVSYADTAKARVEIEFNRPDLSNGPRRSQKAPRRSQVGARAARAADGPHKDAEPAKSQEEE